MSVIKSIPSYRAHDIEEFMKGKYCDWPDAGNRTSWLAADNSQWMRDLNQKHLVFHSYLLDEWELDNAYRLLFMELGDEFVVLFD